MLVYARTVTAAVVFGIVAFAGSGAMLGAADVWQEPFELRWGDLNCSGEVQSVDAVYPLHVVVGGFGYIANGICDPERIDMFPETLLQVESGRKVRWADVDCSGKISSVDALWLLRHVAGLPAKHFEECPEVGAMTTLSHVQSRAGPMAEHVAWELQWGDVDCSQTINAIDALKVLRYVAGYRIYQDHICYYPDTLVQIEGGPQVQWADADCNGTISSVDALRILRYIGGYHIALITGCPDPGAVTVS